MTKRQNAKGVPNTFNYDQNFYVNRHVWNVDYRGDCMPTKDVKGSSIQQVAKKYNSYTVKRAHLTDFSNRPSSVRMNLMNNYLVPYSSRYSGSFKL